MSTDAIDRPVDDADELYVYEDDPYWCGACDEFGMRVVCIDDMCRGLGECMHGDGMAPCDCPAAEVAL